MPLTIRDCKCGATLGVYGPFDRIEKADSDLAISRQMADMFGAQFIDVRIQKTCPKCGAPVDMGFLADMANGIREAIGTSLLREALGIESPDISEYDLPF